MIKLMPFKAILMNSQKVEHCSAVPYDVIDSYEASTIISKNPYNFLAVTHSEVLRTDLPYNDLNIYKESAFQLNKLLSYDVLYKDVNLGFYVYKQEYKGKSQYGIVGLTSIYDYENNKIKKHELTRIDKEEDRIKHFYACKANTEPIFLFHQDNNTIENLSIKITQTAEKILNFTDEQKVKHSLYPVYDIDTIKSIQEEFAKMFQLYIADGHHRCASAYKVGKILKSENPNHTGNEPYNFNLSVIFPKSQLTILPYNRLVTNLQNKQAKEILFELEQNFEIKPLSEFKNPDKPHQIIIYLENNLYELNLTKTIALDNIIDNLNASIVQNLILEPIFNITNPRTSKDIEFYGGDSLEKILPIIPNTNMAIFMYPTKIDEIIKVSDNNLIMPPKSTWFEPKLRSGLFLYKF